MIFMDCGSWVRVEVLANPLSSEDSEQDGKDVSLRQLQQARICYSYYCYSETLQVDSRGPARLLEFSSQLKIVTYNK